MGHVVITGGSSGMGAALAKELAKRGQRVGLIARRSEQLAILVNEIRDAGGKASFATADVTDRGVVATAVGHLVEKQGPVDIIVANAGIGPATHTTVFDVDQMCFTMRVNFDGVVNTFAAVLPDMLERNSGHLAAVSSIGSLWGLPVFGAYSASKAAVSTLLESMATDLAPTGLRVTTIRPGFVNTPLIRDNPPMPMTLDCKEAARIMANGLLAGRRYISFPLRSLWLSAARFLVPDRIFDPIANRMTERMFPTPDREKH